MKKILVKGPYLTQSGYGHHARTVIRALETRPDLFDIYLQPISWGHTSWIWEDNEERARYDEYLQKTINHIQSKQQFDMSLQVTIPNEWEPVAPINVGVTAGIEVDRVAKEWIEKSVGVNKILTISEHSKNTYENTVWKITAPSGAGGHGEEDHHIKTPTEIVSISYPALTYDIEKLDLNLTTDFNFLCVAQLGPRKNVNSLISCFVETFKDNENVGLIIKANSAKNSKLDRFHTERKFKEVLQPYKDRKCKIYLLHGYLNDNQMAGLYNHSKIKALVSTTHGEGFGLPIFEAACYGLPVIATNWSGHLDFLNMPQKQKNGKIKQKSMFSKISYSLEEVPPEAVWNGVIVEGSKWANPEQGSIKMNLEEVYKDHGRFKKRAKQLQKWVNEEFDKEKQYKEYVDSILSAFDSYSPVEMSDAWLNNMEDIVTQYD